jgi:hypothetical protein
MQSGRPLLKVLTRYCSWDVNNCWNPWLATRGEAFRPLDLLESFAEALQARPRRAGWTLALACPSVLPSDSVKSVGTRDEVIFAAQ